MGRRAAALTLAALAALACDEPAPHNHDHEPARTPAQAQPDLLRQDWDHTQAHANSEPDPIKKLNIYKDFQLRNPGAHAYTQALQARLREAEAAAAPQLRQRQEQVRDRRAADRADLTAPTLTPLAELLLFDLARWSEDTSAPPLPSQALQRRGAAQTLTRPLALGPGAARAALLTLARTNAPEHVNNDHRRPLPQVASLTFNALLRDRLGGDLFDPDALHALRKDVLTKLLSLADLAPDAPFLGVKAVEVYPLIERSLKDLVKIADAIAARRAEAESSWRRALASNPDREGEEVNEGMMSFYRAWPSEAGLSDAPELSAMPSLSPLAGFWLRRLGDGTFDLLRDFLHRKLAQFDAARRAE